MPAAQIDGNTRATGTNLTGLNATTGFTLSWWYRPYAQAGISIPTAGIFQQTSTASTTRDGYSVGISANGNMFISIAGGAGNNNTNITPSRFPWRSGQWGHYAVTFDDATNVILVYANGQNVGRGTNTRDMSANAACTTTLFPTTFVTNPFYGFIFDLQVLPDTVIPPSDIRELMDPTLHIPETKGRYFGLEYAEVGLSGTIVDESGNGNGLTMPATGALYRTAQEPPFRFTIA